MKQEFFFELPEGQSMKNAVILKMIETIPPDWEGVDGRLTALKAFPNVLRNECFIFRDSDFQHKRLDEKGKAYPPNFQGLFIKHQWPEHIEFTGSKHGLVPFENFKALISGYVELDGYEGEIKFYTKVGKYQGWNGVWCNIQLQKWEGLISDPEGRGINPARITFGWNDLYEGGAEDVAPLLEMCKVLNLVQYEPSTTEA